MRHRRESGEVVVEASIIVTLVVIFVTIMLYVGMVLYQRTLVSVLANRTASDLAQVYSNSLKDPLTGYIDPDQVYQSVTYGNMKTDAYLQVIEQKANALAQYRLKSEKILNTGSVTVDVEIVKKPNELFKNQIVVTIHDQYDVPLVGMFDVNGGVEFAASGRADCVDYLEYMNSVEAAGEPDVILPDLDTCIVTFVVDRYSGKHHATVPVRWGQSIITSHSVTHSVMPGVPVNGPLKFTGWATADGTAFTAKREINESITVYGTWECTVTLQPEGGEVSPTALAVPLRSTTKFPTPTRFNHTFDGWFTEKDGKGIRYRSNVTQITGNVTLYAKWTCTHAAYTRTLITPATCQRRSVWCNTCQTCPYTWEEYGAMGTCQPGDYAQTIAPGCTTEGRKVAFCIYCGRTMTQTETSISPLGHDFESYKRAATCEKEGIEGRKCRRCGYEEGKTLPKTAHNFSARCGVTHYYYKWPKPYCTGADSEHYWDEGFQCKTCIYCGSFEAMSYSDTEQKYYKGFCRRRMIKDEGGWIYLYSSENVWCVEHRRTDKNGDWLIKVKLKEHYVGKEEERKQEP